MLTTASILGMWKSGFLRAELQIKEIFTSPEGSETISKLEEDSSTVFSSNLLSLDDAGLPSFLSSMGTSWDARGSSPSGSLINPFTVEEVSLLNGSAKFKDANPTYQ